VRRPRAGRVGSTRGEHHIRDSISYISDNYDPLIRSGQMQLLRGDEPIVPRVLVKVFLDILAYAGCDRNQRREDCGYISDLIPTSAHIDLTWVMRLTFFRSAPSTAAGVTTRRLCGEVAHGVLPTTLAGRGLTSRRMARAVGGTGTGIELVGILGRAAARLAGPEGVMGLGGQRWKLRSCSSRQVRGQRGSAYANGFRRILPRARGSRAPRAPRKSPCAARLRPGLRA